MGRDAMGEQFFNAASAGMHAFACAHTEFVESAAGRFDPGAALRHTLDRRLVHISTETQ